MDINTLTIDELVNLLVERAKNMKGLDAGHPLDSEWKLTKVKDVLAEIEKRHQERKNKYSTAR